MEADGRARTINFAALAGSVASGMAMPTAVRRRSCRPSDRRLALRRPCGDKDSDHLARAALVCRAMTNIFFAGTMRLRRDARSAAAVPMEFKHRHIPLSPWREGEQP
jgi:hypothetical protein